MAHDEDLDFDELNAEELAAENRRLKEQLKKQQKSAAEATSSKRRASDTVAAHKTEKPRRYGMRSFKYRGLQLLVDYKPTGALITYHKHNQVIPILSTDETDLAEIKLKVRAVVALLKDLEKLQTMGDLLVKLTALK